MRILAASEFEIFSNPIRIKGYTPGKFKLGHDMILQIRHIVKQGLTRQKNQVQINKDNKSEM